VEQVSFKSGMEERGRGDYQTKSVKCGIGVGTAEGSDRVLKVYGVKYFPEFSVILI